MFIESGVDMVRPSVRRAMFIERGVDMVAPSVRRAMFIERGVDMVRPSVRRAMFREHSDQNVVGVGSMIWPSWRRANRSALGSIDMALLAEGELVVWLGLSFLVTPGFQRSCDKSEDPAKINDDQSFH